MTAHHAHQPPPARQSATPVPVDDTPAEASADVIVVGAGGGGLPTALFSRWLGDEVILLEKADQVGGTARKAAFWYWIPGNEAMRTAGIDDPREDFLRYVSRLSRPTDYDPQSPTLGLDTWSYQQFEAIYDSASTAAETLREHGALPYRHVAQACDYWAELPENAAPRGRVLIHEQASPSMADGGLRSVESMTRAALADGISLRTGHRVQRLVVDGPRVAGVEATDHDGRTVRFLARKAVIFATGGFTHDAELRKNYLSLPLYPGCGARTNEGDFVRIAGWAGAQLRNMNYAWMCPISLEGSIAGDPTLTGVFSHGGDSMIMVDAAGRRVVNEKLQYNELAQEFFRWDPVTANYPNRVLISIWDQRAQEHSASADYGNPIVPAPADCPYVIRADTLAELADRVRERLACYSSHTGGLELSADFRGNLTAAIERFNGFARRGVDDDFARGTTAVQFQFNGAVGPNPYPNATMHPISAEGPFYAALLTGGTLDTKGGPKATPDGRILDDTDTPIPGLFGVGNCVASASAGSYWAGGATLGPIIALAHRAARAAHQESAHDRRGTAPASA